MSFTCRNSSPKGKGHAVPSPRRAPVLAGTPDARMGARAVPPPAAFFAIRHNNIFFTQIATLTVSFGSGPILLLFPHPQNVNDTEPL